MKKRMLILLILLIIPLSMAALDQEDAAPDIVPTFEQNLAEGVQYQEFHLTSPVPVNLFVAWMTRSNPTLILESSIAQGKLSGGTETVSGMVDRYQQALNYWGAPTDPTSQFWGPRNNVYVAINGYYYNDAGVPRSGQIHSGWYAKRYFQSMESMSGFVWKMDRSVFMGQCITHPQDKQILYIGIDGPDYTQYIDGVNLPRGDHQLFLYTPQFDATTNTNGGPDTIEVLIEMKEPTSISVASDMPHGVIREVRDQQGSTPIPFDHVVLSAHGTAAASLRAYAAVGREIAIAQRIKDCTNSPTHNWNYAYAGVGGQFYFLRNGVIYDYADHDQANTREPRTAIAYNGERVFFIVADGRNPGVSEGMTVGEMAAFAKNVLGATDGILQDGGGSSTFVLNTGGGVWQVKNNTYCNIVYCGEKVYLPAVSKSYNPAAAADRPSPAPAPSIVWEGTTETMQRMVANGMMIVGVEPIVQSAVPLDPGDPVAANGTINIYLGPGTNYAVLTTVNGNGVIMNTLKDPGLPELGGVNAKGFYWWKVDFGTVSGWVRESDITPLLKLRSTDDFKTR